MNIKNEKLTDDELNLVKKVQRNATMGDFANLSEYNTLPWFSIKKFYQEEQLVGYVVIFLGYHSIESQDISIEDIAYWGLNEELYQVMKNFIAELKIDLLISGRTLANVYYEPERFIEEFDLVFSRVGFQKTGRTR